MSLLTGRLVSEGSKLDLPVRTKKRIDECWSEVVAGSRPSQAERLQEVEDELSHGVNLPGTAVQSVAEPAVAEVGMVPTVLWQRGEK